MFGEPADYDLEEVNPPPIEVEVTEPRVLGVLYGPDGEVLATLVDRPIIDFGFH